MEIDGIDRKILNMIQTCLPLSPEPYRELGGMIGIGEEEVIARIKAMTERGLIRRLGAIFDSRKLGYKGVLCAVKVDGDRINEVATVINSYPGVTHNYLREHTYNMWFTALAQSGEELDEVLSQIRERTGIDEIITLPAENIFKIRVNFDLE